MPTIIVSCGTETYKEDSAPFHNPVKGSLKRFVLHFSGTEEQCREKLKEMRELFNESNIQPEST